jgi:hypothetical protein
MNHDQCTTSRRQVQFAALRRFVRQRVIRERCELCAAELPADHRHLIEPESRRLFCACDSCALLFFDQPGARYRRVSRRVQFLRDFSLTDAQWEELQVPISLAFFFRSSSSGRVVAAYPSPAGATESLLTLDTWRQLEASNPILREMETDIEALLVNRVGEARDCYRVSIDECYKLVGLIRTSWRGLSGGAEVWNAIGLFFDGLRARSDSVGGSSDA